MATVVAASAHAEIVVVIEEEVVAVAVDVAVEGRAKRRNGSQ